MRLLPFSIAVAFAIALAGCGHEHITLSAPPNNAPLPERANAFMRIAPIAMGETHVVRVERNRNTPPVTVLKLTDYLQLANGMQIYYPEDLIPVLPTNSISAQAAARSSSARDKAGITKWFGSVIGIAGMGLAIRGLIDIKGNDKSNTSAAVLLTTGLIGLFGGAILGGIGMSAETAANDQKTNAFLFYEQGLHERLDVCWDGRMWVNCSSMYSVPSSIAPGSIPPVPGPSSTLDVRPGTVTARAASATPLP